MEKPASVSYRSYRICSEQFTAQDFMDPGHTRLTKTAVPTVYSGAVNVPSVRAFVASFQNPVPEDHLDEAATAMLQMRNKLARTSCRRRARKAPS